MNPTAYPTLTGLVAYTLSLYFLIYFEVQAWTYWRYEKRHPDEDHVFERKWVSVALGLVCATIALPALIMNGVLPPSSYDAWRAVLVGLSLWLWRAIVRVEAYDKHDENRRRNRREVEEWRRQNKEYLRDQADKLTKETPDDPV